MRTTVDIDAEVLNSLRHEAHRRGVPFKHLLNSALRRGLSEAAGAPRRRRYRCPRFQLGAPQVGVNLDKALALAAALEDSEVAFELDRRK